MSNRIDGMVSVIMPCYNAQEHVAQAIESVLTQTHRSWELLVVDDGSTDGSFDVIKHFASRNADRILPFRQKNRGQWSARNAALRHSRGEFIACLDADDYWRDDFFEKMVSPLNRNEADISYCGWQNFGGKAPGGKPYIPPPCEAADPVRIFLESCPWPIHAALTRWKIFEALGGFSERHLRSMDYDFWLRTLSIRSRYRLVPHVLAFYRWEGQGQMSDSKAIQALNTQEIRERFVTNHQELVAHIPSNERKRIMVMQTRRKAYELYRAGEMEGARMLFFALLARRALSIKDLRYAVTSFLPSRIKDLLVRFRDGILASKFFRTIGTRHADTGNK